MTRSRGLDRAARSLGARQVQPGVPVAFWLKSPGVLGPEWGAGRKKRVVAVKSAAVELSDAEDEKAAPVGRDRKEIP